MPSEPMTREDFEDRAAIALLAEHPSLRATSLWDMVTGLADVRDKRRQADDTDAPWVPKVGSRVVTLSARAGVVSFSGLTASNGVPSTIVHMDNSSDRVMYADDSLRPLIPGRIPPKTVESTKPTKPAEPLPKPDDIAAWTDMNEPALLMGEYFPNSPFADETQEYVVKAGITMLLEAGVTPFITVRRNWLEQNRMWHATNGAGLALKAHDWLRAKHGGFVSENGWAGMLAAMSARFGQGNGELPGYLDLHSAWAEWAKGNIEIDRNVLAASIKKAVVNINDRCRVYLYLPSVRETSGRSVFETRRLCRTIIEAGAPVLHLMCAHIGRPTKADSTDEWTWLREQMSDQGRPMRVHALVDPIGVDRGYWPIEDVFSGKLDAVFREHIGYAPNVISTYPSLELWLETCRSMSLIAKTVRRDRK